MLLHGIEKVPCLFGEGTVAAHRKDVGVLTPFTAGGLWSSEKGGKGCAMCNYGDNCGR